MPICSTKASAAITVLSTRNDICPAGSQLEQLMRARDQWSAANNTTGTICHLSSDTALERWPLTSKHSLSCARPIADG